MGNINGQFTLQQNAAQQIQANNDKIKSQQQQHHIIQQVWNEFDTYFNILFNEIFNFRQSCNKISTANTNSRLQLSCFNNSSSNNLFSNNLRTSS